MWLGGEIVRKSNVHHRHLVQSRPATFTFLRFFARTRNIHNKQSRFALFAFVSQKNLECEWFAENYVFAKKYTGMRLTPNKRTHFKGNWHWSPTKSLCSILAVISLDFNVQKTVQKDIELAIENNWHYILRPKLSFADICGYGRIQATHLIFVQCRHWAFKCSHHFLGPALSHHSF